MNKIYAVDSLYLKTFLELEAKIEKAYIELDPTISERYSSGGRDEHKSYKTISGIALYSIDGPMIAKGNWASQWFGIMDYETISNDLAMMAHDPEVKEILISMSTPGGTVAGISDVSDAWKRTNQKKPITVHTSGSIASAGLWLACHSTKIYASPSGKVGSLGAKMGHMSVQGQLEEEGVKFTEFKSAKFKAIGSPYMDLTEEEKVILQSEIDEAGDLFKATVFANRPQVSREVESGLMFSANKSLQLGLIDGVKTYGEVFETLSADRPTTHSNPNGGISMKIKMTEEMAAAAVANGADLQTIEIVSQEVYDAEVASGELKAPEALENEELETVASETSEVELSLEEKLASVEAEVAALKEDLEAKMSLLAEAEARLAGNEEQIASLQEKAADAEAMAELKGLVCGIINHQRVALQIPKVDMEDLSAKDVLAIHASTDKMFRKNFKINGHVTPSAQEPVKAEALGSVAAAHISAVGI